MNVAVIGTGYVGLVSGACLAEIGHQVTCVDVDAAKIERLKAGEIPIHEPGLGEVVASGLASGRLAFTSDYAEAVPDADFISIAVGTPSAPDGSADLSYVFAAAESIGRHLKRYAVIADKSTVPVGTAERVAEIIRSVYPGEFDVVSNPEILREGHAVHDFMHPSRIIIGADSERAAQAVRELYQAFDCPKLVMSRRSAELTKYAANAFLATKISFINEIAHLAEELGADVEEVAAGIGSDPRIGPQFLRAGLGWGGSCFPKDVRAILHTAKGINHELPIISAACEMNELARSRVIRRLERELESLAGKRIALLGLSFKNNTDDTRESAALALIRHLSDAQADIRAYDPAARIYDAALHELFERHDDPYSAAQDAHAVIIATEWDEFRGLDFARLRSAMTGDLILDARNLLDGKVVEPHGFRYRRVGRA